MHVILREYVIKSYIEIYNQERKRERIRINAWFCKCINGRKKAYYRCKVVKNTIHFNFISCLLVDDLIILDLWQLKWLCIVGTTLNRAGSVPEEDDGRDRDDLVQQQENTIQSFERQFRQSCNALKRSSSGRPRMTSSQQDKNFGLNHLKFVSNQQVWFLISVILLET